ncbi:23S rRNA (adenine(2030)-N(6))-methyltransferase RlmJ [Psychrosphaera aquimarina]|uniref:Ribosomal RNA large subunit methyltransferase J n=1 Tax=Psychrosphaera aquimarina TaxID=2044854 RepID=A0ABU3R264_9GAMM|nr:23S rRNA (adenine(2030)-N(6))-methyltransferase RlmJ [Psychrosphaera aquimarina]MDU0113756.1 23S rRNA (adenine(2030)-N(6))-methyltransferase RlmJ [Psychrosphaera aquimarina]
MLSYRHGFHAGNHADVLKHLIYQYVLSYMSQKDKPFSIVDTHAGAGAYKLADEFAAKNKEYETGINKLWHAETEGMPESVKNYVDAVRRFNIESECTELDVYPGSPWFALDQIPLEGKTFFHELHPADFELLRQFVRTNRYRKAIKGDGFSESIGLFPPPSKRGVVIVDPPYEMKEDYQRVVEYIETMYKRFSGGVYMIWYPVVDRYRINKMEQQLIKSGIKNMQLFELNVSADTEERGMTGSGMILINPPWTLKAEMETVLPYLVSTLTNNEGDFRIEQLVDE